MMDFYLVFDVILPWAQGPSIKCRPSKMPGAPLDSNYGMCVALNPTFKQEDEHLNKKQEKRMIRD